MTSKITVVLPTYNCAQYISVAIMSVLNQSYKKFEFVIVDDGSKDNTREIVSSFKDRRIRYFRLEHEGIVNALNFGLRMANYDLIGIMHSDDVAHPDWLTKSINMRIANPYIDIVSCWYGCFYDNTIKYIVKTPEAHNDIVKGLLLYSLISHPGCTFSKKKIFEFSDGYSIEGGIEDYALWYKLKNHLAFYNIQEVLIFYRLRKNSLSRNNILEYYKTVYNYQISFYNQLQEHFGLDSRDINMYKGWREYFYGSTKLARKYWFKNGVKIFLDRRIVTAFMISFLPDFIFIKFKENRIRFRINYLMEYFNKANKALRKHLKTCLQHEEGKNVSL